MTEQLDYRTQENGSIDYAHYLQQGREMRSAEIWAAAGRLRRRFRFKRGTLAKLREAPEFPPIMAART